MVATFTNKAVDYLESKGKTKKELSLSVANVEIHDDKNGNGPYIKIWKVDGVDKPTVSQLNALESTADTLEKNNVIRATRRAAYGDIGEQLDEIYKDIDAWKARIKKIKDDNPKE